MKNWIWKIQKLSVIKLQAFWEKFFWAENFPQFPTHVRKQKTVFSENQIMFTMNILTVTPQNQTLKYTTTTREYKSNPTICAAFLNVLWAKDEGCYSSRRNTLRKLNIYAIFQKFAKLTKNANHWKSFRWRFKQYEIYSLSQQALKRLCYAYFCLPEFEKIGDEKT